MSSDRKRNLEDLPFDNIENILLRLPIRSWFTSKSVCKSWYSLISKFKLARDHLLHTIILLRLPIEYLPRLKLVSKAWYSLISDSKFARLHHRQSKSYDNNTTLIYHSSTDNKIMSLNLRGQYCSTTYSLDLISCNKVLCICEGLLLLSNGDRTFVLWNPYTRAYTEFSCKYSVHKYFGLCYDASADDYKVVCFYNKKERDRFLYYFVYSFRNNSWGKEKNSSLEGWINKDPPLFLNGALHWVQSESRKNLNVVSYYDQVNLIYKCSRYDTFDICCFDPRDEKLKKFSKPSSFEVGVFFQLYDLRGKLSVCRYTDNNSSYSMAEIWTMEEYSECNSWTKLITLQNVPSNRDLRLDNYYVKPLYLTNEGSYVLEIFPFGIVTYSPKDDKFHECHPRLFSETSFNPRNTSFNPHLCWNRSLLFPKS